MPPRVQRTEIEILAQIRSRRFSTRGAADHSILSDTAIRPLRSACMRTYSGTRTTARLRRSKPRSPASRPEDPGRAVASRMAENASSTIGQEFGGKPVANRRETPIRRLRLVSR